MPWRAQREYDDEPMARALGAIRSVLMTSSASRTWRALLTGAALAALFLAACSAARASPQASPGPPRRVPVPAGPFIAVLGTSQDGGLPHASCGCPRCREARHHPQSARAVACLAIVDPAEGARFLIDATPDLPEQLERLRALTPPTARPGVDRAPLSGILLTHAHIGHYLGLAWLGFEAVHTHELPVHATPRLCAFLTANGPWNQLVARDEITLVPFQPEVPFALTPAVSATAFLVPHRDELSDTVAFRIAGPHHTVLYVPDTDGWQQWDPPLQARLEGVDVALLDGSFYSLDELGGRDLAAVRHPLMGETMDLLQPLADRGLDVRFTHLNHTNRALGPGPEARREIERRGFHIAAEGAVIEL